jgi:hypothetical protein
MAVTNGQEIPHFSWNLKVFYRYNKGSGIPSPDERTLLCTKNITDISSRRILTYIFI